MAGDVVLRDDSVLLLRAADHDDAFRRALELGRESEESYYNADGEEVCWVFTEILTLDEIAGEDLDGKEFLSEMTELEDGLGGDHRAPPKPEQSKPETTI